MIKVYNLQAVPCAESGCTATVLKGRTYCARHGGPERVQREMGRREQTARREAWSRRKPEIEAQQNCARLATAIRMAAICASKERDAARAKRAAASDALKKAAQYDVHYDNRGRPVGGGLGTMSKRNHFLAEAARLNAAADTHRLNP